MVIAHLEAPPNALVLELTQPHNWTRVTLQTPDQSAYLGADDLAHVRAGLLRAIALPDGGPPASPERGARWAMSLTEGHSSAYVSQRGEHLVLTWQDGNAELVGSLELDPQLRACWERQIRRLPSALAGECCCS